MEKEIKEWIEIIQNHSIYLKGKTKQEIILESLREYAWHYIMPPKTKEIAERQSFHHVLNYVQKKWKYSL